MTLAARLQARPVDVVTPPASHDFHDVFRQCFGYVFNSLRRLGIPERDLEDVTHDVFLVVHRKLPTFEPDRPLKPWLFGIAARVASEYRRLRRNARELVGESRAEQLVDESPSPADVVERDRARALLIRALVAVEESRRPVLVMHDLDGIAIPEIARELEIPLNTAYSRLRLARKELAEAVRALRDGEVAR